MIRPALLILTASTTLALGNNPCDDCDEGQQPGPGTITVTFDQKIYRDHANCDGPDLCTRITLNGTVQVDSLSSLTASDIDLTGVIITNQEGCCAAEFPTLNQNETITGTATLFHFPANTEAGAILFWGTSGYFNEGVFNATCDGWAFTETTFDGDGGQTITTLTVSSSGGECQDIDPGGGGGGGDDDNNPDGPDDPPEPPGPDDPPDRPDPPDPPQPPDVPDPDDDPDEPDPPDPPNPDPDDPCCAAITSRLDILITYAEDHSTLHRNTNQHLENTNTWLESLYHALISPDLGLLGLIPDIQLTLYDMRAYMGQMQALMMEDREYQHDQTWYLEQIWASTQNGNGTPDDLPEEITFDGTATGIAQLPGAHLTAQGEHDQVFGLPDIPEYSDSNNSTWQISLAFARNMDIPLGDITLDLSPYQTTRDLVRGALLLLASLNGIYLVWGEFRKT